MRRPLLALLPFLAVGLGIEVTAGAIGAILIEENAR